MATEENAMNMSKDFSILHFACHGFLDERFPLNSGLALTIPETAGPGKENGLLQAWEIFEGLRINADLVTLSACETGLGKEMGGEGLIGLTRAFQYAGARTVLSSLWSVSDESTAVLMKHFYTNLKQGKPKAEALRLAQAEMMRSEKYSHPFYWAGFVLNGDFR
jgi:CHAT domain-containing protein